MNNKIEIVIKDMGFSSVDDARRQIRNKLTNNFKRSPGCVDIETQVDIILRSFAFFDGKCLLSSEKLNKDNWHLDHVVPVYYGGFTEPWNLLPLCDHCNIEKSAMHLLDFVDYKKISIEKVENIFLYLIDKFEYNNYKLETNLYLSEEQIFQDAEELLEENKSLCLYSKKLDSLSFFYQIYKYLEKNNSLLKCDITKYRDIMNKIILLMMENLMLMNIRNRKN